MNRIDQLIRDLCPNGVKYRALGEVGEIFRGKRFVKADMVEEGTPCIHYGEIYTKYGTSATESFSFVTDERARTLRFADPGDVIMASAGETIEDIGKSVAWLGKARIVIHDACYAFSSTMDPVFVAHFFASHNFRSQIRQQISSSKISSISTQNVSRARIPVPPLEIQREIADILDTFSELEAQLGAELAAELEVRTRQYEYYLDDLLTFGDDVPLVTIEDVISNLRTGLNPRRNFKLNTLDATNQYITVRELGGFDVVPSHKTDLVNDEGLALIQRRSKLQAGDILYSGTGTIGRTALVSADPLDWNIKEGVYALTPQPEVISSRFLIYLLHSSAVRRRILASANGSTVASVSMTALRRTTIPLPPLEIQHQIVSTLDNLGVLVNDLSVGLPAEITARRQQYEYYLDRLLTFREFEVSA